MTEEKETFEPIVWVGVALLIAGIAYAWLNLILFNIGPFYIWLDNDIYRYLAFIPAFMSMLPLINGTKNRQPTCLRNSVIFLSLTLIIPSIILGLIVLVLIHKRGTARSVETPEIEETPKIQINYSFAKNCDTGSFNAYPKTKVKIDIEKVLEILKARGYSEVSNAMVKCVVDKDGIEITMNFHGDVIVKTEDEELASKIIAEIYKLLAGAME